MIAFLFISFLVYAIPALSTDQCSHDVDDDVLMIQTGRGQVQKVSGNCHCGGEQHPEPKRNAPRVAAKVTHHST